MHDATTKSKVASETTNSLIFRIAKNETLEEARHDSEAVIKYVASSQGDAGEGLLFSLQNNLHGG